MTRRNCLPASTIPAAHQRSAICPSRQRLTLVACSRQTEIIEGEALGEIIEALMAENQAALLAAQNDAA